MVNYGRKMLQIEMFGGCWEITPVGGKCCLYNNSRLICPIFQHYESLRYGSMKYMDVDKPIYKVCMEPSKNIGFSKLRLVEESSRRNSADLLGSEQYLRLPSSPSIASSDPDSGQGSCFGSSHHASNNENGAHYLKLRLRDLKDIPLDGDGDEVKGHWVELPPSCFKTTMVSFIEDDDTESCRVEGIELFISFYINGVSPLLTTVLHNY